MTGNEANYLANLAVRGKIGQKCVWRWQELEERVVIRCVQDELESADRGLKRSLLRPAKRERKEKRYKKKEKGERQRGRG